MERVRIRPAVFPARDPDLVVADIVEREPRGLASSKAVAIHKIEEQHISNIPLRDNAEQALHFVFREVLDRLIVGESLRHSAMSRRTRSDFSAFPHLRSLGRTEEEGDPQSAPAAAIRKRRLPTATFASRTPEIAPMRRSSKSTVRAA